MAKKDAAGDKKTLTSAHEDYLKAIYILSAGNITVSNSVLANHMAVSPASATNMVKKLADLDLVIYEPYQSVSLSPSGERVALEVLRHHRLLELYLHQELSLPWDQVHAEAERLEHVISEALEDAISSALGNPSIDPHGDPIPTKKGRVEHISGLPLSKAVTSVDYRLVRVLMQDEARLRYLGSLGIYPNARLRVLERSPFQGPLLVDIDGEHHALAYEMAASLQVAEWDEDEAQETSG